MIKNFFIQNFWFNKSDFRLCSIYQFIQLGKYIAFKRFKKIFFWNLPLIIFATISKTAIPAKLTINYFPNGKKKT